MGNTIRMGEKKMQDTEKEFMTEEKRNLLIMEYRKLIRWDCREECETDQMLRRKQPPLVKPPVTDLSVTPAIPLPRDFSELPVVKDLSKIFAERSSHRVYSGEEISLNELSFLLWATQGIKSIRGKRYATIRTVPSGGARHPFETYFLALHVKGIKRGLYHYLPISHSVEMIEETDISNDDAWRYVSDTVCGQRFVENASVIFYYSIVPYRAEWRYAYSAHRVTMMDLGHISENMYIACTALKLGTCGIAAVDSDLCNTWMHLDGDEEDICYAMPVGTLDPKDLPKEDETYAFLREEEQYYE